MSSLQDHQQDFPGPIKGQATHNYEEIRVPPKQWEKQPCSITEQVVNDFKTRSLLGLQKYGVTLDRKDLTLRDFLQHAYEECLDQAKYLKRAIQDEDERNRAK
jgi:hypothetical protein